ncbi:MAG: 4-hydroxybenzoate transporter MFS-type family [Massilia sp.]|nr:4-hydroxybenzoate transporter MFS-type family [Massilia sp.]
MEKIVLPTLERPTGQRIELRSFLNGRKVSRYQYFIFFLCFLILLLDGYDTVVVGFIAPALRHAWTLNNADLALMFGMGLAGLTLGSFFSGPVADRLGRKGVIVASVLLFGIVSLLSAYSPSIGVLTLMRFLTGLGLGGAMPNAYTLAAEFCPDRLRATLVAPIGCALGGGGALCGLLASHLVGAYGWPSMLIVGGILPLLLLPVLILALPESVRYRVISGKGPDKLAATMRAIAPDQQLDGKEFVIDEKGPLGSPLSTPVRGLFASTLVGGTVCLWITAFCCLLVVYFLGNWLPTLINGTGVALSRASLMTAMYLTGNTLGAIVLGFYMDRRNPQYVLAIAFVLAGAAMASFGLLIANPLLSLLALFITGVGTGGAMTGTNILAAGFYPTTSRATGVSWTLAMGRVGSVLGSVVGGAMLAAHWGLAPIFTAIAAPIFVAALSMLALAAYRQATARNIAVADARPS